MLNVTKWTYNREMLWTENRRRHNQDTVTLCTEALNKAVALEWYQTVIEASKQSCYTKAKKNPSRLGFPASPHWLMYYTRRGGGETWKIKPLIKRQKLLEWHSRRSLLPSSGTGQTCFRLSPAPVSRLKPGRPEPEASTRSSTHASGSMTHLYLHKVISVYFLLHLRFLCLISNCTNTHH